MLNLLCGTGDHLGSYQVIRLVVTGISGCGRPAARQLPVTGIPLCPLLFPTPKITITTAGNTHLSTCGLVLKTHETDLTVHRGM